MIAVAPVEIRTLVKQTADRVVIPCRLFLFTGIKNTARMNPYGIFTTIANT